jgi:outer membrane protein TolC
MTGPPQGFPQEDVNRKALACFPAILIIFTATAFGGGPPVDFPTAVSRALKNNPSLSASGQEWLAAKKEAEVARGYYLPSLALEERFTRTNVPAEAFALKINQERMLPSDFASVDNFNRPPPVNDYMTAITAEQVLFAPKVYLGYRMAGREAVAKGEDFRHRKEEVVFRVLSSYLDVLTAKEYVRVAAQAVDAAREHHRVAETVVRSGMGLASDVLRAKVFLASAESGQVTADNRLALAKQALALAMGERGGTEVDAAAAIPALPEEGSLDDRITAAVANRADLRAFSARVENAGENVTLYRSDYLPAVGLMGAYQLDGRDSPFSPDNRSWKVGVGLRWNLFDGLRREAAVARAAAESGKVKESYRGAQDYAAFQVSQAYLSVKEAARRVEIARSAVAAAEEGTRLIRARYENQLTRMVELLDAQSALDAVRADLVKAENDLCRYRGELLFASGTLFRWAVPGPEEKR